MDSATDELDLHGALFYINFCMLCFTFVMSIQPGLYVKEAIAKTETAVQAAQSRGDSHIRIIVGKGLHSQGHAAKLKPAIEELMVK